MTRLEARVVFLEGVVEQLIRAIGNLSGGSFPGEETAQRFVLTIHDLRKERISE